MASYLSCKPLWSLLSLSREAPSSEGIPWQDKDREQKEKQRKRGGNHRRRTPRGAGAPRGSPG
jgi:hypothetical protein